MADLRKASKLIYTSKQVEGAIDKMSEQITNDLREKHPIFLCVVNGGIYLVGKLMTKLEFPIEFDYVHASRYQNKLSGNQLRWYAKPQTKISGRHIAIVDDVLDQGITLQQIKDWCIEHGAKSVYTIVLIDKLPCRAKDGLANADCYGLTMADDYIFGCGLDVKGFYRNSQAIYAIPEEIIPKIDLYIP